MRDLFGFERQPQPASVNTPAFASDKKEFEIQGSKKRNVDLVRQPRCKINFK